MFRSRRSSLRVALSVLAALVPCPFMVQAQAADPVPLDSLARSTPSGEYIDPASFFRFHGYVTINMSEVGADLGSEAGRTPQILVSGISPRSGRNESGFKNDAALFVGGEPFDGVGSVVELHLVGNALDPVLTEAKITWDWVDSDRNKVTLSGGRFWWPFGIHNSEWFSSVNRFAAISPAAGEVVPAHYNEVGFMLDGVSLLSEAWGINYVAALGNGVQSFELMDNVRSNAIDQNGDRSLTARVALVHKSSVRFEVGFSGAHGQLRAGIDESFGEADARRYSADYHAFGPDLRVTAGGWAMHGYYYRSVEDFEGASVSQLNRDGFTLESSYRVELETERLRAVSFHGRASSADEDTLTSSILRRNQYALGTTFHFTRSLQGKLGYVIQREGLDAASISDNIFSFSLTAEF